MDQSWKIETIFVWKRGAKVDTAGDKECFSKGRYFAFGRELHSWSLLPIMELLIHF